MKLLGSRYSQLTIKDKKGFTLIELVVVIAIMAILALILVPNLTAYIYKAEGTKIKANMKNIHTAAEIVQQSEGLSINNPDDELKFLEKVSEFSNTEDLAISEEPILEIYTLTRDKNSGTITVKYLDKNNKVHVFNEYGYTGGDESGEESGEEVDGDLSGGEESVTDAVDLYLYSGGDILGFNHDYINSELGGVKPTDLILPKVTDKGQAVTGIADKAFQYDIWDFSNSELTSVVIPEGVTSIGEYAFDNNQLTSVKLPSTLTSIGKEAFQYSELTSVVIPEAVQTIGYGAFSNNELTSVKLPSTLTHIGPRVFFYNKLTSVELPSTLTSIGSSAFYSNKLTSVVIPEGVKTIDDSAFSSNELTSVKLPSALTEIAYSAFSWNQLTSVELPSTLTSIDDAAFRGNQLTSVVIPEGVTSIGSSAFQNNPELTSVDFKSDSVTSIGRDAFGTFRTMGNITGKGLWKVVDGRWRKQ